NSALMQAGQQLGKFDVVVSADLDVLPAGQTLAASYGAEMVYDAHEYWPYSHFRSHHWEHDFWGQIEQTLVEKADICMTVSSALAERLAEDHGVPFLAVPNCERRSAAVSDDLLA